MSSKNWLSFDLTAITQTQSSHSTNENFFRKAFLCWWTSTRTASDITNVVFDYMSFGVIFITLKICSFFIYFFFFFYDSVCLCVSGIFVRWISIIVYLNKIFFLIWYTIVVMSSTPVNNTTHSMSRGTHIK